MPTGAESKIFDTIVIGGGFAGMSAAMNAASEGLSVHLFELQDRAGGQGGSTSLIRNYMGFPNGVSGAQMTTAGIEHLHNFKVKFRLALEALRIVPESDGFTISCDDGASFRSRSAIIACGLKYRRLDVSGEDQYMGNGVSRGFPLIVDGYWEHKHVVVVGAGNSGAQCCEFLANCDGCNVTFLVRGDNLADTMSGMYVDDFTSGKYPNIQVRLKTTVEEIIGNGHGVNSVRVRGPEKVELIDTNHVCVLIGADPRIGWLGDLVALDRRKFIPTDRDLPDGVWKLERKPYQNETSVPGIFAAGDVRLYDRKRATAAIHDGQVAAASCLQYIRGLKKAV